MIDERNAPRARTRLHAHLTRIGVGRAAVSDAVSQVQVQMLGHLLTIVETAMQEEGIPEATIRRVTDLVIYGGSPNPAEVAERQRMTRQMIDTISTGIAPSPSPIRGFSACLEHGVSNCEPCLKPRSFTEEEVGRWTS